MAYSPRGVRRFLHILGLSYSSAIEVLIHNPTRGPLWLSRVFVGGGYRLWDGILRYPSAVNYYLRINCASALRKSSRRLISGLVGTDSCFAREVEGTVSWFGGEEYQYESFWLSFALHLEIPPEGKRLVRFAIEKVGRRKKVGGKSESWPDLQIAEENMARFGKEQKPDKVNAARVFRWLKLSRSAPQDKYLWIVFEDEIGKQFGGFLEGKTLDQLLGLCLW
jgi:hypothetical protein